MSYTSGFTAVTSATYTAAQYNTYVRDNFAALWVFNAAGDLIYATSGATAARLALVAGGILYAGASAPAWLPKPGSGLGFLYQTSGNAPGYASSTLPYGMPRINGGGTAGEIFVQSETSRAYRSSNLNSSSTAETAILFNAEDEDSNWHDNVTNSERITPISSGRYRVRGAMRITNASGVNIDSITLYIKTSTALVLGATTIVNFVDGATLYLSVTGYTFDLTAGQYFTLTTSRSNVTTGVTINQNSTWLEVQRVR